MNRIKKLRSEAGLLQADLAKKLKIRQNTVSNWETGRHEPDQDALREMSKLFGVSIDYPNNTPYLDVWQGAIQDIVKIHKILVFNLDTRGG